MNINITRSGNEIHCIRISDISIKDIKKFPKKEITIIVPSKIDGYDIKRVWMSTPFMTPTYEEFLLANHVTLKIIFEEGIEELVKISSTKVPVKIQLPSSLKSIGRFCFANFIIKDINIQSSNVETISEYAFSHSVFDCDFIMPKNCRVLDSCVFRHTKFHKNFKFAKDSNLQLIKSRAFNSTYFTQNKLVLPKSLKKMDDEIFIFVESLWEVAFPKDCEIEEIEPFAFCQDHIRKVTFEKNKNPIKFGYASFSKCFYLSELIMHKAVVSKLPSNLFSQCPNLKKITLPSETVNTVE